MFVFGGFLKNLLDPKKIVVIGASKDPSKIGHIIFDNLREVPGKKVFGVNPNASTILGEKIYPTVIDIKDKKY